MIPYMRYGTQSGMSRMTNSKKSNQIPGHGKKMIEYKKDGTVINRL